MENSKGAVTLLEFQQMISNTIRMKPELQARWVIAELSDVRVSGGHCYMELVEKDSAGGTRAKMRAMIWSSLFMGLRSKFHAATGSDIRSGLKVMVRGSANHHNVYGLSFVISDIDPSYTMGDMERLRREILDRLAREGVAGSNRSLGLPPVLQRIAVISAPGAAGYGDFMNQIGLNSDGFVIYPMLFPAVMQGDRTVPSVLDCLDRIEQALDFWDCVVIIRGGGATTDLNGFDNYELARRVATFPVPVVVGIGHERDRTVLDELACVRCKTPTAVAAFIIDRMRDYYARVADLVHRVARYDREALKGEHLRLANLEQTVPSLVKQKVMRERLRIRDLVAGVERGAASRVRREETRLDKDLLRIFSATSGAVRREEMRLEKLDSMVRVLSPENILRRGYSITRIGGKSIRDASVVKPGEVIETRLANGTLLSKTV
jgi:hypothetical protein BACCOPRO_02366